MRGNGSDVNILHHIIILLSKIIDYNLSYKIFTENANIKHKTGDISIAIIVEQYAAERRFMAV